MENRGGGGKEEGKDHIVKSFLTVSRLQKLWTKTLSLGHVLHWNHIQTLSPGTPVMHSSLLASLRCLHKHWQLLSGKACRIKLQMPVQGFCALENSDLIARHSFVSCTLFLTFLPCFPCDWQPFKTQSNRIVLDGGRKHCHQFGISLLKQLQVINSFKGEKCWYLFFALHTIPHSLIGFLTLWPTFLQ